MTLLHPLKGVSEKPECFNDPFNYEPHPLCLTAADEVMHYVASTPQLQEDALHGKMFGVLIVETPLNATATDFSETKTEFAFLAAYSGLLAGRNDWPYFVPPVFDAQQPDGHFKQTERFISAINKEVTELETAENHTKNAIRLSDLKQQRKQLSEELQLWLFRQYRMFNARGEAKDLIDIWRDYHRSPRLQQRFPFPPGGSGDCCAPKLLQYAFLHGLKPVVMAEFWYGESPRSEIRHHAHFYPACRGKCLPILTFMLEGMEIKGIGHKGFAAYEGNPGLHESSHCPTDLTVLYEDSSVLVIEKPSGLLSVPGRIDAPSVQSLLEERYDYILMPHRLDMDTSGLMVIARNDDAYKNLQQQFYARTIQKEYLALLDGIVEGSGTITLALRPDPLDRPRQVVDPLHGKHAITDYQVLSNNNGQTLIALKPHTGRTHQLRVHCAHPDGLGTPIVGDHLYGKDKANRLCLHACSLTFTHPMTGERMTFEKKITF